MAIDPDYERIDAMKSVSDIQSALTALDEDTRRRVILTALRRSTAQWTWSYMATHFRVPDSEWPERD